MRALDVVWFGVSLDTAYSGYGVLGYKLGEALGRLVDRGMPLRLCERYDTSWDVRVYCGTPYNWMLGPNGATATDAVLFTMFDARPIPRGWVEICNRMAAVIVPSQWVHDSFRESGVTVPIEVVQLGLDPDWYKPVQRSEHTDEFVFMAQAMRLFDRKGLMRAVEAYWSVADQMPGSALYLKINEDTRWQTLKAKGPGKVRMFTGDWLREEMDEFVSEVDCFVYPTHGEGFGLMPLEMMARGLPVILPAYSGLLEFADARYCYPFPVEREEPAGLYNRVFGCESRWATIDKAVLAEQMLHVYRCRDEAKTKGLAASEWVRSTFTWDRSAERTYDALRRLVL